jgi:hypothetical protein
MDFSSCLDVLQDSASLAYRLTIRTGTHLDLLRDAAGIVAEARRDGDAFDRMRAISDGFKREIEAARRGDLRPRSEKPWALWAVCALHVSIVVCVIAYPIAVPASRGYDLWFLGLAAAVYAHWWLLCGECALSYVEKRLFYESYEIGSAPHLQWFLDDERIPWQATLVFAAVMSSAIVGSWSWVAIRAALAYFRMRIRSI